MARLGYPEIRALSRSADKLDLFAVTQDGSIVSAAWEPAFGAQWHGWFPILGGRSTPGGAVSAVSRRSDYIDIFCVGTEGGIWTAAWQPDRGWHGWWRIGTLQAPLGALVSAVSCRQDFLDIFVTASNGSVMTCHWDPKQNAWGDWTSVAFGRSAPGTPVTAVSCAPGRIALLLVGGDHKVYATTLLPGTSAWATWVPVEGVTLLPRTEIGATSRGQGFIDFVAVTDSGRIMAGALDSGSPKWKGWWDVASGRVSPGAPIGMVSRATGQLDVFATDASGAVWTAAWQVGDGPWRGWWRIGNLAATPDGLVTCVARRANFMDVFASLPNAGVGTAAWQIGDTVWRGWWTIGSQGIGYTAAMVPDPQIGGWSEAGDHRYGGDWQTHTVQGITFRGASIFVSVTTHDSTCIIYRFAGKLDQKPELGVAVNNVAGAPKHVGDLDHHQGTIYVSLEEINVGGGVGVLELDTDLKVRRSVPLSGATPGSPPPQTHCPWVAVNPWTGMLYSSDFDSATVIHAYSLADYTWQEAYSIHLSGADVAKVGGGVFDNNGHLIMTSDAYDDIRAFNAVSGAYQGNHEIGHSSGEEIEGVAIAPVSGKPDAVVHVMQWKGPGVSLPGQWGDALRKIYAVPKPDNVQPHP